MAGIRTPVNVELKGRTIYIGIEGLDTVERALGNLKSRTPQALKVAVNQTARQARRMMITAAKARYVVNAAGQRHLDELKQKKKATNSDPAATLYINTMRNDLAYFENVPSTVYSGMNIRHAPDVVTARVLAGSNLKELTGKGNLSKGFLAKFKSGHIGMVQRIIGSESKHTVTASGRPRWRNAAGKVEKLQTMGSPSATAMHRTVWPDVQDEVRIYLMARIQDRVDWILNKYGGSP